ncbi:flippase-like domain-containing protein, partial [Aduncisulcus paluster]
CLLWLSVLLGFWALVRGRISGLAVGLIFPVLTGTVCLSGSGFLGGEVGPVLFFASLVSLAAPLAAPEFLEDGFIFRKLFKGSKLGERIGEVTLPVTPDFNEVFFAAPLSFLAGVIPAPAAGLGVNEAAFETLLNLGSSGAVTAGASIFLMYRIWVTLFSLSGLYFVMRTKK